MNHISVFYVDLITPHDIYFAVFLFWSVTDGFFHILEALALGGVAVILKA